LCGKGLSTGRLVEGFTIELLLKKMTIDPKDVKMRHQIVLVRLFAIVEPGKIHFQCRMAGGQNSETEADAAFLIALLRLCQCILVNPAIAGEKVMQQTVGSTCSIVRSSVF
jgi:hypothetical protein